MEIYCCGCQKNIKARLTDGSEIYPHRRDLYALPFWICNTCGNYVGTHHKTKERTKPLGNIPTRELREARKRIHAVIDPAHRSGRIPRGKIYGKMSVALGYTFHSGEIKTLEEADRAYELAVKIVEGE